MSSAKTHEIRSHRSKRGWKGNKKQYITLHVDKIDRYEEKRKFFERLLRKIKEFCKRLVKGL